MKGLRIYDNKSEGRAFALQIDLQPSLECEGPAFAF